MADKEETKDTTLDEVEDETQDEEVIEDKKYDKKYVDSLKKEAKDRRLKLRDVEAELKKFKDEKLTEGEKDKVSIKDLEKKVIELEKVNKNLDLNSAILGIASGKGFIDLKDVLLVAKDALASEEEIDEKLVERTIDKIIKDKPHWIASSEETNTGGTGNSEKQDTEAGKDIDGWMMKKIKR